MAEAGQKAVIGVFHDRDRLEQALEGLQSHGLDRAQLSVLATAAPARQAVKSGAVEISEEAQEKPVDRAELGNVQGLASAIPTYIGAVVAAGVTIASGGALAGVAVAALAGGAGGAAVGVGAARLLRENLDSTYDEQLARGGVILMAWLLEPDDEATARAVLAECGATDVETIIARPDEGRAEVAERAGGSGSRTSSGSRTP